MAIWGSASWLQWLSDLFVWTAFVSAVIAGAATLASTILANRVSNIVKAEADRRQQQAEDRIAINERQTAEANARAEASANEAAQARLELERLRERVQWREIIPAQVAKLTHTFSELIAGHPMNIKIYPYEDSETINYAAHLAEVTRTAGYSSNTAPFVAIDGAITGRATHAGILIADEPIEEARALHTAFAKGGIDTTLAHLDKMGPGRYVGTGELMVEIWRKPTPRD